MGGIGGMLGLSGGAAGTGFDVTNPLQPGQLQAASAGVGSSLQSQQALLAALQAQNGIGNQNQVYGQLQGIASGAVNPAQSQFAQNTQQNVANQAALMAGQRGANQNVGLMARQAAQQGAATQQQAAGQEATQQAQNQIAGIAAAGNLATTQAGQQIGATTTNTQANLANQGQTLGAAGQYNAGQAGLANTQLQGQQAVVGGALGGAGAALGMAGGGTVPYASGGDIGWINSPSVGGQGMMPLAGPSAGSQSVSSGLSSLGKYFQSQGTPSSGATSDVGATVVNPTELTAGANGGVNPMSAPVDVNPLMPLPAYAEGGNVGTKLKQGGSVPGKAKVAGNSLKNDTVKAKLSPGELVVDRETMNSQGPDGKMARLLATLIAHKKGAKQ